MLSQPDLAEAAFTQATLERPLLAAGNFQSCRGPPAKHVFLACGNRTAAFGRARRRLHRSPALRANFEHIHRIIRAGKEIRPVRNPLKIGWRLSIDGWMCADELSRFIECHAREQYLPRQCET